MNTKGKIWKKILIAFFVVLLVAASGSGGYFYYLKNNGTFLKKTTLNGYDVSEKTPEEVYDLLEKDFEKIQVVLLEQEEKDLECKIKDLGVYLEKDRVMDLITEAHNMQIGTVKDMALSVFHGLTFRIDVPSSIDETVFAEKIKAESLAVPRTPSKNAKLKQKKDGNYKVTKEVYGNEFVDADLQYEIRTQIGKALSGASEGKSAFATGKIDLTFPEQIYIKPTKLSTNKKLTTKRDVYNRYCQAEITYQYGSEKEVLDWSTVKDWVIIENGSGYLSEEKIREYVENIAVRYNTRYHERTFHTTYGGVIQFTSGKNEYGYTVNQDAEYAQLLSDLTANEKVTREPVYYQTNNYGNPFYYRRNGKDDLAGTYVEVNLSAQHLWFYKNGVLIIESDLVSGCVAKKHETTTGVYPLAYKKSPDVLVGSNANDGYRTEVQYWMPFYEGQGLHDATWRSAFGGNIYQTNGSHGCVNLPLNAAAVIYQNIEPGMAIILYR